MDDHDVNMLEERRVAEESRSISGAEEVSGTAELCVAAAAHFVFEVDSTFLQTD